MPEVVTGLAEAVGKNVVRQAEVGNGQAAKPGTDSEDESINKCRAEVSITRAEDEPKGYARCGVKIQAKVRYQRA